MIRRFITTAAALFAGDLAQAQDSANVLSARVGLGVSVAPGYFGSDDMLVGPTGSFRLEDLQFGRFAGGGDAVGFGVGGSFRYIGERNADDFDELTGLDTVDAAVELGGGLRYAGDGYRVFANLRYGVIGHESWVGDAGADLIMQANDQLTLTAGPRLFWGSDAYAQTYFGVTAAESGTSSFAEFDAEGGLLSAAFELAARYQLTDDWGLTGTLRYDQLQQAAADSPITQTDDQVGVSLVVDRLITLRF